MKTIHLTKYKKEVVLKRILGEHLLLFQTMPYNYYWLLFFENDLWDSSSSVLEQLVENHML